jgi:propanol-preferring alcohol dehydrogenase
MDMKTLAPIFCAGTTAFNAVTDTLEELNRDPKDTSVAVIGCGGLGHMGIQYLKAHGCKVIGIDLSPTALEEAKAQGADHVFNPMTDKDYVQEVRKITGKGCHAAINFTNSVQAYWNAPEILRYNGVLMVTGIPQKPLQFNAMDISMLRVRVRGSNNGRTDQLRRCIDFSHKHGIKPHVTQYKLENFQDMLDSMMGGHHQGRMGVLFE